MNKYVLIPDSFKGTMTSEEICNLMESAIKEFDESADVVKIPVADGGEGSVDCFLAAVGGKKIFVEVNDANFEKVQSFYGIIEDGKTAVIEMAACAGLPMAKKGSNPAQTTTFGVGELIQDAKNKGVNKIILGLGGSSTNDCGTGMLAGLGVKFFDLKDNIFVPTGETLSKVARFDDSELKKNIEGIQFVTMCDIDNPLHGKNGASYVFARQKGADDEMIEFLDSQLIAFSLMAKAHGNNLNCQFAGSGAAGGMGFATKAFLNSEIQMGIKTVLDIVKFDEVISDANYIFTGEGKIDGQSLRGKVVVGVARKCKSQNKPVIAVVGDVGEDIEKVYSEGVTAIFSINRVALQFEKIRVRAKNDLRMTMRDIMKLIRLK